MSVYRDLKMYARFTLGLPAFLRFRMSPEEARRELEQRFANREANFLRLVEKGVFGHPRSPYLPLFARAGCTFADLSASVRSHGLESALLRLREAGVYVGYEEFKGRAPIRRPGLEVNVAPGDFDNPFLKAAYVKTTGGTSGAGTRVMTDVDNMRAKIAPQLLADEAYGVRGMPLGIWRGGLPDAGLGGLLRRLAWGEVPERWFVPVTDRDLRPALEYRLATAYVLGVSRLCGVRLPRPERVPVGDARRVAAWVHERVRTRGSCMLRAYVSLLVRVSRAAQEQGLDLTGAVFGGGGEPPTPGKVAHIEKSGARYYANYSITEFGRVGFGCMAPASSNDTHFAEDHLALVQYPQAVPGTDLEVEAFHFSTLLASSPKIAINVESDDYGIVEERACGCPLEAVGWRRHLRDVGSFRKLTSEGMTLVGTDMLHVLEVVLPQRFGGSPGDYQLRESEDEDGFTRLELVVSPRLAPVDDARLVEAALDGLSGASAAADLARATWRSAGSLRVVRDEPTWTARGKLMPLHLARRAHAARTAR